MTEQSLRNVSATLKYGHQLEPSPLADVVFPRALLAMYIQSGQTANDSSC